ncbi:MAG: STAS domain-containing protein [Deltaproteobacteria bacterium]|nr:STAS domain-containing protein [Deltaproteobacteria bacterium]
MRNKTPVVLRWDGDLVLSRARELKESLLAALSRAERVELDLSDVTEADASCLQLLCAAHKEASALGKTLAVVPEPPPVLADRAETAGFRRTHGCASDCLWRSGAVLPAGGPAAGA